MPPNPLSAQVLAHIMHEIEAAGSGGLVVKHDGYNLQRPWFISMHFGPPPTGRAIRGHGEDLDEIMTDLAQRFSMIPVPDEAVDT